ncbi:MAG: hypothetical protein JO249_06930 [Acidobacteria bacterium]|nr:hypothetical protein [Acidobacteriota bacterium]
MASRNWDPGSSMRKKSAKNAPANPAQIEQLTSVVAQQQQIQHLAQQRQ